MAHRRGKGKGKARLAEYFAYSDPNRYTAGADEITGRIILVKVWIQRKEKKGDTRWTTPIPSAYFDIRNEKGFSQTKAWYKKHKAVRHEITLKTTVTKAVNFYMRSLEDGAKMSPSEAYRIITQRLGKRSQELVRLFNEQIAGLQKQLLKPFEIDRMEILLHAVPGPCGTNWNNLKLIEQLEQNHSYEQTRPPQTFQTRHPMDQQPDQDLLLQF